MRPSNATAGGAAGGWRWAGLPAATPSMPAVGIPCHELDRPTLASDLAPLVDGHRRPDPRHLELAAHDAQRQSDRRRRGSVWRRHRPAHHRDQADPRPRIPVPADDLAPGPGGAASDRAAAGCRPQKVQEGSAAPEPGDDGALQGAQHQPAGADERLPASVAAVPDPNRPLLRHPGRPPDAADP